MSDVLECDISSWVEEADSQANKAFREAVHTTLLAIASNAKLKASMILKGGILMAIRYKSHRYTRDIDFSTEKNLGDDISSESVRESLDDSLVYMVEMLDYDLDCRVQTCKIQPRNPNSKYPSIKVTIGYAYKGTPKHSRLALLKSPDTISIDYSLNEAVPNVEAIKLDTEGGILVYSLTDIIAEKYRSLLQQIPRNRTRRQDVYDLNILISNIDTYDNIEKQNILDSLMAKCKAREITPSSASFDTPEIKERAKQEYSTLADEIEGDLPDFDALYDIVYGFYKSLPWE